ncbi:nuclease-related domain-containing protein [Alkalibacillus sp. S2W]|uniref:nuclease-related domain-containing protein n=1 Tax=Alkalibacillus sp. S2W TaxID=3386553 RepID=UPI00398D32C4
MNLLPLQKPLELLQLEVLIKRYRKRDQCYAQIQDQYHRELAGYLGEKALQYYFSLLRYKPVLTLFGLRAKAFTHYFQIDALLITRQFLLIVESKHTKGVITENDAKQMIQHADGNTKSLQHPLHQADIQRRQLQTFLMNHHLDQLPIYTCATFTHPEVIIDMPNQPNNLFTHHYLLQFIYDLLEENPTQIISSKQAQTIGQCLVENHAPQNRHLAIEWNIKEHDLIHGPFCPRCSKMVMNRKHGTWFCPSCQLYDKHAHTDALRDLLIYHQYPEFSNQVVKNWLNIDSPHVCKRLLASYDRTGEKRLTKYNLSCLVPELKHQFRRIKS